MSPIDKTIFGYHFRSDDKLQPTRESLRSFLESPKKEGLRELCGGDLGKFAELVSRVQTFERDRVQDSAGLSFRDTLFYGVLSHTHFAKRTLLATIEHYKFYVHALQALDFKKPTAFITAAQEEMARLDPKRTSDAVKLVRFREMINVRKKTLTSLSKRWADLDAELTHITRYVRTNLGKIAKLCELSIDILRDSKNIQEIERQAAEDIRAHFKAKESPEGQSNRKQGRDRDNTKKNIALLSRDAAAQLQEDVKALSNLYRSIHDQVTKSAQDIDTLLARIENRKRKNIDEDRGLFAQVERALVSLVSDHQFEVKRSSVRIEKKSFEQVLMEKRKQMIEHLFELLQRERRKMADRRSEQDRRAASPEPSGPDKRSGSDRRSGTDRRKQS